MMNIIVRPFSLMLISQLFSEEVEQTYQFQTNYDAYNQQLAAADIYSQYYGHQEKHDFLGGYDVSFLM